MSYNKCGNKCATFIRTSIKSKKDNSYRKSEKLFFKIISNDFDLFWH